jgi:hypothetical protein
VDLSGRHTLVGVAVQDLSDRARDLLVQTAEDANARLEAGDPAGAKRIIAAAQRELRDVKRQVNDEQRIVREQFQQARLDINQQGQTLGMVAGSKARGVMARGRAYEKRALAQQQQDALTPYNNLKAAIDRSIADLDRDKFRIDEAVREDKEAPAEPGESPATPERGVEDAAPPPASDPAKTPPPPPSTPPAMPAHWAADPSGRHELRFWDGSRWSEHVSDGGRQSVDPLSPRT